MASGKQFFIKNHAFSVPTPEPALYIVSTPIGNLRDISIRALEILAGVDLIACEDTRTSGNLLKAYGIENQKTSYHEHNAAQKSEALIKALMEGKRIALISDAGTPMISDPGQRLVKLAIENQIAVVAIPGASAILAGLVSSGLTSDEFTFIGFLPTKANQREVRLQGLKALSSTLVFYESPKRILKTLEAIQKILGENRQICLSREVTKLHESHYRGTAAEVIEELSSLDKIRGEMVLMVSGSSDGEEDGIDRDQLLKELMGQMSLSKAAAEAAKLTGHSKRELYQRALELSDDD